MAEEVQWKHWEGGNMQEEGKKKKKTKELKKAHSSSRDHAVLKQKTKEKKPESFEEEGEHRSNGISVCGTEQVFEVKKKSKHAAHSLCKWDEHEQAQEDGSHDAHVDHNVFSADGLKRQCKKVRFLDQFAFCQCQRNVSREVCTHNSSASKEPSADGCVVHTNYTISHSFKKENNKEVAAQDRSMDANAGQVDLFTRKRQKDEDDEIWGKRFTSEEDEVLKKAVLEYIKVKGWEEKAGIDKVLNCRKHKEALNCWGIIRMCLPRRPRQALRCRVHRLFEEPTHTGFWSKEEEEVLKRLQKEHGNRWKNVSALTGRSQFCISQKWRCLKRLKSTGVWTWDEVQRLSDLVHKCLWLKALGVIQYRKGNDKFLRDNIRWNDIADAIGTHNHGSCCTKWYSNLSSSMVVDGLWASQDDYILLKSLLESGASTEEEVEWHRLLNHRSGHLCIVRWKQMVKYLGENRTRGFLEKLDSLVRRYAPKLLSHEDSDKALNT